MLSQISSIKDNSVSYQMKAHADESSSNAEGSSRNADESNSSAEGSSRNAQTIATLAQIHGKSEKHKRKIFVGDLFIEISSAELF